MTNYYLPLFDFPEAGRSGQVPPNATGGTGTFPGQAGSAFASCPEGGIPPDFINYEVCNENDGFTSEHTFSPAALAVEVAETAAYEHLIGVPEYCTYFFTANSGQLFPGYKGCYDPIHTVEANGYCGDHDWGGVFSDWTISGGTGMWVPPYWLHDTLSTHISGVGPQYLGDPANYGTSWQQGIYWGMSFAGFMVNPSPPSILPHPDPRTGSLAAELLFPIGEPPPDFTSLQVASGGGGPSLDWSFHAAGYYHYVPPPPPPPSDNAAFTHIL